MLPSCAPSHMQTLLRQIPLGKLHEASVEQIDIYFIFRGCGVVACVFVCVQTIVGGICVLCACVPHVLRESCPNDVVSCLWLWALPGLLFFSVCVGCLLCWLFYSRFELTLALVRYFPPSSSSKWVVSCFRSCEWLYTSSGRYW